MKTQAWALLLILGLSGGALVGCNPAAEDEVELEEEGGEVEVEEE
ncbi:MAG: hypothetical protein ACFB4I_00545 [Cyanophyceae cyanobacterium]